MSKTQHPSPARRGAARRQPPTAEFDYVHTYIEVIFLMSEKRERKDSAKSEARSTIHHR